MSTPNLPLKEPGRFAALPTTGPGRWAVLLAVASAAELAIAVAIGAFAAVGVGLGVAAAPVALFAILKRGERAATVYLAFLPLLFFLLHPLFVSG